MSKKTLQNCMKNIEDLKRVWPDFEVSIEDISTPTPNSVLKLYGRFLYHFQIDLNVVLANVTMNCKNVDSFSESLHQLIMYFCVKELFQYLEMDTHVKLFSLRDIFDPLLQRNQAIIIVITNISQYVNYLYTERLGPMAIRDKIDKCISDASEYHKELNKVKNQMHMLSLKKANEDIPEYSKLVAENEQVLHTRKQLRLQNEELLKEKHTIDSEINSLKIKQKEVMELLKQKLLEYSKLKLQIVQNPDAILAEIQFLENKTVEASSIENENMQILANKNQLGLKYAKIVETCRKLTDVDIIKIYERNHSVRTSIELADQRNKNHWEEIQAQTIAATASQKLLTELEKQLQSSRLKRATRKSAFLQEIQRLDDELLSVNEDIQKDTNELHQLDKQIVATNSELTEYNDNLKYTTEHCGQQYNQILHEYELLERSVERNLKEIISYKY